jgi:hypothetical protein
MLYVGRMRGFEERSRGATKRGEVSSVSEIVLVCCGQRIGHENPH